MDPDVALIELRELCRTCNSGDVLEIIEKFEALDQWLSQALEQGAPTLGILRRLGDEMAIHILDVGVDEENAVRWYFDSKEAVVDAIAVANARGLYWCSLPDDYVTDNDEFMEWVLSLDDEDNENDEDEQ